MADKDKHTDKNHPQKTDQPEDGDHDLWERAVHDVEPLKGRPTPDHVGKVSKSKREAKPQKREVQQVPMPARPLKEVAVPSRDVDGRTMQRLKRGQMIIEGRLDLHGMTREQAYDALRRFITQSCAANKRCVLVITGKGGRQFADESLLDKKMGVLRANVPQWLADAPLNQHVLKSQTARPADGGEGALYVLLRRQR